MCLISDGKSLNPAIKDEISLSEVNSNLAKRGLENLLHNNLTPEEIANARNSYSYLRGLSDESINLAIKKPLVWEQRLFCQVFSDEVDGYESLRQARSIGFTPTSPTELEFDNIFEISFWCTGIFDEIIDVTQTASRLMSEDLQIAFGQPDKPGNSEDIILIARKLGLIYKHFLEVAIRCENVNIDPIFKKLIKEMSKVFDDAIREFEDYPKRTLASIMELISAPSDGKNKSLQMTMKLTANTKAVDAEMKRAIAKYAEKYYSNPE
jgi:hypothetical protein